MTDNPTTDTAGNPLATKPILPLLWQYALPSIISMLVNSIYNIVDQVFIGRGVGYLGNGATTVAFPVITMGIAFATMVGNGSAAYMSLQMGKGNKENAKRALGQALVMCTAIGVLLSGLCLVFMEPLLHILGASPTVMGYAADYTSIIVLGFPFSCLSVCLSNIIRADGSPRFAMLSVLCGAVLNVLLDPIFIFPWGLDMGVRGAAIATVLSQIVSLGVVLYYFWHRGKLFRFSNTAYRPNPRLMGRIAALGSASFITQMAIAVVNLVLNNSLTYYGAQSAYGSDIALSAVGIVMKINAIVISVVLGFIIGAQPILGYNYGAGNFGRVRKTYFTTISFTLSFTLLASILFVAFPQVVVSIFNDPDPMFNEFAARSMRIFLCCVLAAGLQIPSANYFQAVGKPLKAMTLSMSRQLLILVPAMLILPRFFGLDGILYAGPVADLGALAISSFFIVSEMHKLKETADRSCSDEDLYRDISPPHKAASDFPGTP